MNIKYAMLVVTMPAAMLGMQQAGARSAVQSLTLMSPHVSEAMRLYRNRGFKPDEVNILTQPYLHVNRMKALKRTEDDVIAIKDGYRDFRIERIMKSKYPEIKRIPAIYRVTNPAYSDQSRSRVYATPDVVSDKAHWYAKTVSGSSMPIFRLNPPRIMYNAHLLRDQKALEFILLRELGHFERDVKTRFIMAASTSVQAMAILGAYFLNTITMTTGALGFYMGRKCFLDFYVRWFEQPAADDFAIAHADISALEAGSRLYNRLYSDLYTKGTSDDSGSKSRHLRMVDFFGPSLRSRINKIDRAICGVPHYSRIARLIIILAITEEVARFLYTYANDLESLQQGLKKVLEIEQDFEAFCDKHKIPADEKGHYKTALLVAKRYLLKKLVAIQSSNKEMTDQEIMELIIMKLPDAAQHHKAAQDSTPAQ